MSYYGDIALGDTIDFEFNTKWAGSPSTLGGSPVISAYIGNSTTEIATGITLTVDFDGRTGFHHVRVVATTGNGYSAGTNVRLVITTGTVNGSSVVGDVVGRFSIQARTAIVSAFAAGQDEATLRGTATAGAAGTITLPAGAVATDNFYNKQLVAILSGTGAGQSRMIASYVGSTKVATVSRNWATNPDNTSVVVVIPSDYVDVGYWAGTAAALVGGLPSVNMSTITAGIIAAASFAANALDAVWSTATRVLTAGTNIALAKGTGVTGFNDLSAAQVTTAASSSTPSVTVSDKTGFSLSAAGVQAVWDALTSALTTVGSIGKLLVTNIDAAISTRLATSGYTTPPTVGAIRTEMDANSTQLTGIRSDIANLSNLSAFSNIFGPAVMEIPDSGSVAYFFRFVFKDLDGHLVDVDTNTVTLAAKNSAGTDRSGNWSAVTHESTGKYTAMYTVTSASAKESLLMSASATVSSAARSADFATNVADYDSVTLLNSIYSYASRIPVSPTAVSDIPTASQNAAAVAAQITTDHGAGSYLRNTEPDNAGIAEIAADTDTLLTRNNALDAAGVRAAVGMASPNFDTQISEVAADTDSLLTATTEIAGDTDTLLTNVAEVQADTDTLITNVGAIPTAAQNADKLLLRKQSGGSDGVLGNRVMDMLAKQIHDNGDNSATVTNEDGTTYTLTIVRQNVDALTSVT